MAIERLAHGLGQTLGLGQRLAGGRQLPRHRARLKNRPHGQRKEHHQAADHDRQQGFLVLGRRSGSQYGQGDRILSLIHI